MRGFFKSWEQYFKIKTEILTWFLMYHLCFKETWVRKIFICLEFLRYVFNYKTHTIGQTAYLTVWTGSGRWSREVQASNWFTYALLPYSVGPLQDGPLGPPISSYIYIYIYIYVYIYVCMYVWCRYVEIYLSKIVDDSLSLLFFFHTFFQLHL